MDFEGCPLARDGNDKSCLTLEWVYGQLQKVPDEARREVNTPLGVHLRLLRRRRNTRMTFSYKLALCTRCHTSSISCLAFMFLIFSQAGQNRSCPSSRHGLASQSCINFIGIGHCFEPSMPGSHTLLVRFIIIECCRFFSPKSHAICELSQNCGVCLPNADSKGDAIALKGQGMICTDLPVHNPISIRPLWLCGDQW